jgi:hypothetical protein
MQRDIVVDICYLNTTRKIRSMKNEFIKNTITLIAAIIGFGLLSACVGPTSYTGNAPAPAGAKIKDWRTIEVVHLNQIKRDYEIIGECRGDAWLDNAVSLKKQAARLGADAISIPENNGFYIISQAIRYKR